MHSLLSYTCEKNWILLKNVLNESVEVINFIKYCPLCAYFNITPFDSVLNTHKPLLYSEIRWLSEGAALVQLFELWAKLAVFFMAHHFYLEKNNYSCLSCDYLDFDIWQKVYQKWTNIILLLSMIKFKLPGKDENVENFSIL